MALIVSGIWGYMKGFGGKSGNAGKAAAIKPLVAVETVQKRDMVKRIVLSGQTVPAAQVDIAAKYTGRIVQVTVELGQRVEAGQVLIIQDTRDIDLIIAQSGESMRLARAESVETKAAFDANYRKAEADYQRNLDNLRRYESLHAAGAVSRENLDTARQQLVNAKAALDTLKEQAMTQGAPAVLETRQAAAARAEYMLEAYKQQREDMVLRAPRNGIIGYRQAEAGALVQDGQKLLTVVDNSSIYIDCQVAEQNAAYLVTGMELPVTVDSLGKSYPGKITYISPVSNEKTQAFTVRILLLQGDLLIKGGMFAHANAEILLKPKTIFVSKEAVLDKNGKKYVFVIHENKQAEQRQVRLGLANDEAVEILEGVKAGELVAGSNVSRLKQDMQVEVEQKAKTGSKDKAGTGI
ncbi:cobalt-zinc-cadmium resistance protein CzcB [Methylomusa anaerophila]|uniref:Cobalt-zinc-cadmium resistance protein CzcB n=1 Tax=Methylomusa anaerophila TaxID=1930071 RepID=A0A348AEA5_9FIRM|nr:cobalt-zinc-cadmium resistance protein CzcB [Methylomusa anaerophila]